jgi:putative membrane protein
MEAAQRWIPYCGEAPGPDVWLSRWNLDPVLGVVLLCTALALWWPAASQAGRAGLATQRPGALRWAWGLTALLYVSPLCALSSAFFTARVVHHMLLVFVLAPLLAFGLERRLQRLPTPLWASTALAAACFWAWHAPGPYAAALSSVPVFVLMQCTLLASAMAFWLAVRRARPAWALAAILVSTVQMGLLGALITFAARPLYAPHLGSALSWGVLPLEDQQLAGILMWAPGSLGYLAAALWIGHHWLRSARPVQQSSLHAGAS